MSQSTSGVAADVGERVEFDSLQDAATEGGEVNLDMILDVPVTLAMEVGRTRISIRNLLQLNQGSVVELDRAAGEPLDVFVNGTLVAHGEVVVINEKFGIRLTDVISPAERVRKLPLMSTLAFMLAVPAVAAPDLNVGGELVRVVLSLLGIVVLILAAGWLNRRLQQGSGMAGRRIRCVESFAVGARERLLLLDADGKRLLIGTGPGGMRTLHVYDEVPADTVAAAKTARPTPPAFSELLARWRRSS